MKWVSRHRGSPTSRRPETEAEEPTDGESAPVADAQLEECPQGKVKCPFCEECTTAERTTCDNCGLDRDEGSSGGE